MWRLACNPIYIVTCLGACMELIIVSGFVVFLPKYLETQFSLGKSQASVFTGNRDFPKMYLTDSTALKDPSQFLVHALVSSWAAVF